MRSFMEFRTMVLELEWSQNFCNATDGSKIFFKNNKTLFWTCETKEINQKPVVKNFFNPIYCLNIYMRNVLK